LARMERNYTCNCW